MPQLVTLGVVGFLAWLFASAGLHKLRTPRVYAGLLARYLPVLPAIAPLAICLGALEILVAVALLLPASRSLATLAAICLLLAYACGMAWQLLRGRADMRCGC
ncbi:MAG: MauE/DoxX family redox-associated membrane protein, partial [Chromatocurvus sp.]